MAYRSEPLDPARHDLNALACGEPTLDGWLREQAAGAAARRVARTFVWVQSDRDPERVVGYYSLTGHRLVRADLPRSIGRGSPTEIPAVLLARLALDGTHQGGGNGGALLAMLSPGSSLRRTSWRRGSWWWTPCTRGRRASMNTMASGGSRAAGVSSRRFRTLPRRSWVPDHRPWRAGALARRNAKVLTSRSLCVPAMNAHGGWWRFDEVTPTHTAAARTWQRPCRRSPLLV